MHIIQAYDEVWQSLKNISQEGVKFSVHPSRARQNKSTINKFGYDSARLPPKFWSHVEFAIFSEKDCDVLREEELRLASLSIAFDTGGCVGIRDWEIDWSLLVATDGEIDAMQERRGMVKNALDSIESVQND